VASGWRGDSLEVAEFAVQAVAVLEVEVVHQKPRSSVPATPDSHLILADHLFDEQSSSWRSGWSTWTRNRSKISLPVTVKACQPAPACSPPDTRTGLVLLAG